MKTQTEFRLTRREAFIGGVLFVLMLAAYARTLAPSVVAVFDDTLEVQFVVPRLGILHQTGYPLYTLLGKLFTLLLPINDPAFRLNLFSAFTAALTVAGVYLLARQLNVRHVAAILAALIFALGETFWAQAVVAEVYALQMLLTVLVLYLTWRYAARNTFSALYALAFAMGLGLAHHRLIALLYPAIALYVFLVDRNLVRDWKTLARAFGFFLLPLSLYLYLPWRGSVGSADGTYTNTLAGFFDWVMASQYTTFLTANPFNVTRGWAEYFALFQDQFTLAGLALAAGGALWLLRKPREWLLLVVALVAEAGFAFNYRTADVQVHFLTTFLLLALFCAAGIDALFALLSNFKFRTWNFVLPSIGLIGLLFIPAALLQANFAANDLAAHWDTHDYGLDLMQPLEINATAIGITGEMTLVRYFQETRHLQPGLQTIAADQESARLAAIETALKQNRIVYLTRPLKGAAEKYSLASFGAWIRVNPQPITTPPPDMRWLDEDFGAVKLLGYQLDASRLEPLPGRWHAENGKQLRVTLYWQVAEKLSSDAMVSVKILRADQRIFGQIDQKPVRAAYPTTQWRAGEIIADTYDVPLVLGVTPSAYRVAVTLYDAATGAVLGQRTLDTIALAADRVAPRREAWNLAYAVDADFGLLALAGYSLTATAPLRPGDALPLTLVWRAGAQKLPDNLRAQIWLEDNAGAHIASRETLISAGYPPFEWEPQTWVRDFPAVRLPANLADGVYSVKLAVSREQKLLGSTLLPFNATVVDLGTIPIKNRARVMTAPPVAAPVDAVFANQIKLLGYDLNVDAKTQTARLTLFWRALAPMDTAYTVFVHALDATGKVVAAGDAPPGNGDLPTTGWIADEYILDAHTLSFAELAPGDYPVEIGLYDPITGARLKIGETQDRVLLPPLQVR